jgi:hypothetical protein
VSLFTGLQLQKKWKNLRDSFFRELRTQKNVRSGSAAPQKKNNYIYFQCLQFLKGAAETNPAVSNIELEVTEGTTSQDLDSHHGFGQPQKKKELLNNADMEIVSVLKRSIEMREERERDIDGDKMFFLSLLDEFKKVPDHLKMATKMEILKTIHNGQSFSRPPAPIHSAQFSNSQWNNSQQPNHSSTFQQRGYYTQGFDTVAVYRQQNEAMSPHPQECSQIDQGQGSHSSVPSPSSVASQESEYFNLYENN